MALVNRTKALFSVATRRLTLLNVRHKSDLRQSMLLKRAICHLVRHHPVDICRRLHTSRSKFSRGNNDDIGDTEYGEFESSSYSDLVDSETHGSLLQDYQLDALQIQKVFVVQPIFVSGLHVLSDTRTDFIKEETFGLVKTLGWEIAGSITLPVQSSTRMSFFGSGQIERIKGLIDKVESGEWRQTFGDDSDNEEVSSLNSGVSSPSCHEVTTVFVSTFRLTPAQLSELQSELEKPVIDRFHVVLQIFKNHSSTRESKLQVQLAEIPYLRQRLDGDHELELLMKHSKGRRGEIYFSKHRMDLARREKRLKLAIESLKTHRAQIRKQRKKLNIPTVAIVGYTNAGKTSLIKALTKSDRLQPEDKLFATLDVTVHSLSLPSGVPSLLVDTVGFISDIPTSLIASFNATLEDAIGADLLIHVRDVSNQDHFAQAQNVLETLVRINTPQHLLDDMIVIGNKIDRVNADDWPLIKEDGIFPISCTEGYGLDHLKKRIDSAVLRIQGKEKVVIRIGLGSNEELQWLSKNTSVASVEADGDHWNVTTLINQIEFNQFKKAFMN